MQTKHIDNLIQSNQALFEKLTEKFDKLGKDMIDNGIIDQYNLITRPYETKKKLKFDFSDNFKYPNLHFKKSEASSKQESSVKFNSKYKSGGLIELKNKDDLQQKLTSAILEQNKNGVPVIKPKIKPVYSNSQNNDDSNKFISKKKEEEFKEDSSSDSSEVLKPQKSVTEKRQSSVSDTNNFTSFSKNLTKKAANNGQFVNPSIRMVEDEISFGDGSEDDSDELGDDIVDLNATKLKPDLKKQQTSVPEELKLKCKPSELLDDFFNGSDEKPLQMLELNPGKFAKARSEAVRPLEILRRKPHGYDIMKQKNSSKKIVFEDDKDEEKPKEEIKDTESKSDIKDTQSKIEAAPKKSGILGLGGKLDLGSSKEETKRVDKFASKTFYGASPMELAKKFDAEKAKEQSSNLKPDDKQNEGVMKSNEKKKDIKTVEVQPENKDNADDMGDERSKPAPEKKNPFGKLFGDKQGATGSSQSSAPKSGGFFGSTSSSSGGSSNTPSITNPTLSSAAFGKSSFTTAPKIENKPPVITAERKFGSAFTSDAPSNPSGGFGFKNIISEGSSNGFLASGAHTNENDDMAEDEDIFGSGPPAHSGFGGVAPNPFGGMTNIFNQPKPSGMFGSTTTMSQSNPSFTQRRK